MMSSTMDRFSATRALQLSPRHVLRKLNVEETETSVILRGVVPSYYLKQLAQETVKSVLGGRKLHNDVLVLREEPALLSS